MLLHALLHVLSSASLHLMVFALQVPHVRHNRYCYGNHEHAMLHAVAQKYMV